MKVTCLLFILFLVVFSIANAQKEVTISNEKLTVTVNTFGAELQSIKSNKPEIEYLWQGDSAYWEGRAPVMFPVNVRFKDDKFTYRGIEYEMPRMGLAKIADFRVLAETNDEQVVLQFKSNKHTLKQYPFRFILEITYCLDENKLMNRFVVENTGRETMYFALGGHPGFRFPFASSRSKNQYTFSKTYTMERIDISNSLVQPNKIPWLQNENSLPLGDSRIPNGGMFVKDMPSRRIGMGVVGNQSFIEVDLGDFPNVNLWSPSGMPFACIEPMLAHHDIAGSPLAIEDKDYLIELAAGEIRKYSFSIIVKDVPTQK